MVHHSHFVGVWSLQSVDVGAVVQQNFHHAVVISLRGLVFPTLLPTRLDLKAGVNPAAPDEDSLKGRASSPTMVNVSKVA